MISNCRKSIGEGSPPWIPSCWILLHFLHPLTKSMPLNDPPPPPLRFLALLRSSFILPFPKGGGGGGGVENHFSSTRTLGCMQLILLSLICIGGYVEGEAKEEEEAVPAPPSSSKFGSRMAPRRRSLYCGKKGLWWKGNLLAKLPNSFFMLLWL